MTLEHTVSYMKKEKLYSGKHKKSFDTAERMYRAVDSIHRTWRARHLQFWHNTMKEYILADDPYETQWDKAENDLDLQKNIADHLLDQYHKSAAEISGVTCVDEDGNVDEEARDLVTQHVYKISKGFLYEIIGEVGGDIVQQDVYMDRVAKPLADVVRRETIRATHATLKHIEDDELIDHIAQYTRIPHLKKYELKRHFVTRRNAYDLLRVHAQEGESGLEKLLKNKMWAKKKVKNKPQNDAA